MSRNIRRKAAAPPKSKRRRDSDSSSSLDLSSDGGYSALDEVSDSEDDDEDGVYAAEEQAIIKDVTKHRNARAPRPSVENDEENAEVEDDDDDDDDDDEEEEELDELDDNDFLEDNEEEGVGSDESDEAEDLEVADDGVSWNGISESDAYHNGTASEAQTSPVKRQVRFAGVPDSDSDSTTTETSDIAAEFFPDIFVEQSSLDPAFRREIEEESDSSVSSSFWDYASGYGHNIADAPAMPFSDEDLAVAAAAGLMSDPSTPVPAAPEEEEEEGQDLDGYETDGDTTEDDEPEPLPLRRKQARRVQSVDSDSGADSESDNDVPVRYRRGHPRVGRFALSSNRSKPIAVMHPRTGKMIIFTPEKPREFDILSDPFPTGFDLLAPHNDAVQSSPLMGNTASVMMGAMFSSHTFGDYVHSQHVGPVEAFFPTLSSDAYLGEDSDFSGEYVEDEDESVLRIEDFIQFDRNNAETEEAIDNLFDDKTVLGQSETDDNIFGLSNRDDEDDDDATTPGATPRAPPNSRRQSVAAISSIGADVEEEDDSLPLPPLMAHFDKNSDAVGAFRRNQLHHHLIHSDKATADSLALSGPYMLGTLRGIKHGSFEAVATPITPPRRPKRQSMSGFANGDQVAQKRKASGAVSDAAMNHKRQRSISEVKDLML